MVAVRDRQWREEEGLWYVGGGGREGERWRDKIVICEWKKRKK